MRASSIRRVPKRGIRTVFRRGRQFVIATATYDDPAHILPAGYRWITTSSDEYAERVCLPVRDNNIRLAFSAPFDQEATTFIQRVTSTPCYHHMKCRRERGCFRWVGCWAQKATHENICFWILPRTEALDLWGCPLQVHSSPPFLHEQSATLQEFAETDHDVEQSRGHDKVIQWVRRTPWHLFISWSRDR